MGTWAHNTGHGEQWESGLSLPELHVKSLAGASSAYTPDKDPILISASQPLITRALEIKWA